MNKINNIKNNFKSFRMNIINLKSEFNNDHIKNTGAVLEKLNNIKK